MSTSEKKFFIDQLQKIFNTIIRKSNFYEENISYFNAKVINLYILDFGWDLNFRFHDNQLSFFRDVSVTADLRIEGDILDFIKAARFGLVKKPLPAGLLRIKGDVSLVQNLQRILIESEVIFEEVLGSYVGGLFANRVIDGLKSLAKDINDTSESLIENSRLFIKEDTHIFVTKEELFQMDQEIMNLCNRVDLIASKYQLLLAKKD